jgi:hypothetical protein
MIAPSFFSAVRKKLSFRTEQADAFSFAPLLRSVGLRRETSSPPSGFCEEKSLFDLTIEKA